MSVKFAAAGFIVCAICFAPLATSQTPAPSTQAPAAPVYVTPRTSFGQPSLEGVWESNFILSMEATPQTPLLTVPESEAKAMASLVGDALGDFLDKVFLDPEVPALLKSSEGLPIVRGQRRTRAVVEPADGMLPYSPDARKEAESDPGFPPSDNPEERDSGERCLVGYAQPPLTTLLYLNRLRIIQTRDHVLLHTEYGDDVRIVPFADKHGPKMFYSRLGDSIAHWEAGTLVIETIGMPDKDRLRFFPTLLVPGDSKVIERLTRVSDNELFYQFTVIDPKTYTAPWLGEFSWYQTSQPMFEHACHEGNYSLPNILQAKRVEDARAALKPHR